MRLSNSQILLISLLVAGLSLHLLAQRGEERASQNAERQKQEALAPEVAPGLRLPDGGGIFIYDVFRDKPELIPLAVSGNELTAQTGKNIVHASVNQYAHFRDSLELPGVHAQVQVHIPDPAIFLYFDPSDGPLDAVRLADLSRRFRMLRVSVTRKAKRIVTTASGDASSQASGNFIETKAEIFHGGNWFRISANVALMPGQYALVEMVEGRQMNIDNIFDFAVNPSASDTSLPIGTGGGMHEGSPR